MGCTKPGIFTEKFQRQFLKDDEINMTNKEMLRFWVHKKNSDVVIGQVAFTNIIRGAFQSCFLSYKLDCEELNKGYITEAIEKGIEIMFKEYKLHRIEANILPRNKASLRVAEKLGFEYEGESPKYLHINGKWEDHVHMVIRNKELE